MTAYARLLRLRRWMAFALTARALMIGVTLALGLLLVVRALGLPAWSISIACVAGVTAAAVVLRRLRDLMSLSRVALWAEERTPALRYALVTVADGAPSPALDAQALGVPWWGDARTRLWRALIAPAIAVMVVTVFSLWGPIVAGTRPASGSMRGASGPSRGARASDVLNVVHTVTVPPSYAGRAAVEADDPTSIDALVGSSITVSGTGDARQLFAILDSVHRSVAPRGNGWSLSLAMPAHPALLRVQSTSGRSRLIVLAPIADEPPVVTLLLPAHDSVVRAATGTYALRAQMRDDIGLRDARFELVVSSGSGENFTFRTTVVDRETLNGAREWTLEARLPLDSLVMKPGDVLQLRAVARDGNTIAGPGIGSSETRSLRVARADEYDSVAVDAAPPAEGEAQFLSQRMLINLTEALERHRARLMHPTVLAESRKIAADQRKLRKRVGDLVFQRLGNEPLAEEGTDIAERGKISPDALLRLADSVTGAAGAVMDVEGDETPILSINKPLLEAFNAMWDAGRALEVGEPGLALPPMRIALAAIQRARQAERIYLRGKSAMQIVDVAQVRLAGKEKGSASVREARAALAPAMRKRGETFERVTALLFRDPDAAADSLAMMRVDALTDAPRLAAALDAAARAIRNRDGANIPLAWARVRRALSGFPVQRAGVSQWGALRE